MFVNVLSPHHSHTVISHYKLHICPIFCLFKPRGISVLFNDCLVACHCTEIQVVRRMSPNASPPRHRHFCLTDNEDSHNPLPLMSSVLLLLCDRKLHLCQDWCNEKFPLAPGYIWWCGSERAHLPAVPCAYMAEIKLEFGMREFQKLGWTPSFHKMTSSPPPKHFSSPLYDNKLSAPITLVTLVNV